MAHLLDSQTSTAGSGYCYYTSSGRSAQSFTIPSGYTYVAYITINIKKAGTPGTLYGAIYSNSGGLPSSSLSEGSISEGSVGTSYGWYTINMADASVTPGGTYWIVTRQPSSTGLTDGYFWDTAGSGSGGKYSTNSGSSWSNVGGSEWSFYVYGYGPPSTPAASSASSVGATSFYASSSVTSDMGATITSRGFCYSSSDSTPTLSNSVVTSGSGTGSFGATIPSLSPGTLYYYCSYATNAAGTVYGAVNTQTTSATTPTVTTTSPATTISYYTATVAGNVSTDGGATVTEKGVCYNTTGTPTILSSKGTTGTGTGAISSDLTSLTANTLYYARAYATNSVGTSYGAQITFTTLISVPTVTTSVTIDNISTTEGKVYGEVTVSGGATITQRGFVYALTSNPTTANSKVTVTGTTGTMEYLLTGLTSGTLYYVRAFATNSEGTAYGDNRSFTTLPGNPSALAVTVTGKTTSTLTWAKGTNGTYTIVRRQLDSPPANSASGTLVYNGTGSSASDTGMSAGGHYYYRAWASTTADGLTAVSSSYTSDDIVTIADFTNATNALTDDSNYATVAAADGNIYCEISKDGGSTWSNSKVLTLNASVQALSFGTGSTELWGMTLTGADITDTNLRIRLTGGSDSASYQVYKTFGFSITSTYLLTGLEVKINAAYDSSDILLYYVKVNPYYGTSPLPVGEGSLAYDSTLDRPTYYDGTGWTPIGGGSKVIASDTQPSNPKYGDLWIDTSGG